MINDMVKLIEQTDLLKKHVERLNLTQQEYILACDEDDKKALDELRAKAHNYLDLALDTSYILCRTTKKAKEEALRNMLRGKR